MMYYQVAFRQRVLHHVVMLSVASLALLMAILGNAELALLDLPAQAPARISVAH